MEGRITASKLPLILHEEVASFTGDACFLKRFLCCLFPSTWVCECRY